MRRFFAWRGPGGIRGMQAIMEFRPSDVREELNGGMNRDEERRLREIEVSLRREDSRFAARLEPARLLVTTRALARCATIITVAGCGLALMGMLFSWFFTVLGVLMAVVGFSLRLTLPTTVRVVNFGGDDEDERGTGHDGSRT